MEHNNGELTNDSEQKVYTKKEFFFMVFTNTMLLALSFILFLFLLNVNDMQKREYAYRYIVQAGCSCGDNVTLLLDRNKDIIFGGGVSEEIPVSDLNPIALNMLHSDA